MAFTVKGTIELDLHQSAVKAIKQIEDSFENVEEEVLKVIHTVDQMTTSLLKSSAILNENRGMK